MHASGAKFCTAIFVLGAASGSVALFPLESQRLWTWLAAWLASQLWSYVLSHFWHKRLLDNIWLHSATSPPPLLREADPKGARARFWMVSALWPWAFRSHWMWELALWGPAFCTVLRFRKEVNPFRQAGPGGKGKGGGGNEFPFTGEMKWKTFLESRDFSVSEA